MEEVRGCIHSTETFGVFDGPGIRFVVFLQGCPLRCLYCHNPDTWATHAGGSRWVTAGELMAELLKYKNYIKTGGVTFSGGEPLLQSAFVHEMIERCRQNGLHTAIDTAGAVPLSQCQDAVRAADLIILDIKSINETLCRRLTGRGALDTLELLKYCEETRKEVWIRHVLVPGLTLDSLELDRLAAFLSAYTCIQKTELIAFHQMGAYKWEQLKEPYALKDVAEPSPAEIEMARDIFKRHGLL